MSQHIRASAKNRCHSISPPSYYYYRASHNYEPYIMASCNKTAKLGVYVHEVIHETCIIARMWCRDILVQPVSFDCKERIIFLFIFYFLTFIYFTLLRE